MDETTRETVKVLVRVRPPNAREIDSGYAKAVHAHGSPDATTLSIARPANASGKGALSFAYDHVCDETSTQREIFDFVGASVVDGVVDGFHGCILAYGQTGAGKTYSMQGMTSSSGEERRGGGDEDDDDVVMMDEDEENDVGCDDDLDGAHAGLIPRVLKRLFKRVDDERAAAMHAGGNAEFEVKCSYLEIYNETLRDLLMSGEYDGPAPNIREDGKRGTFVENLLEERVVGAEQTYEAFLRGAANRRVGQTNMNADSSRSHSVFTISVTSTVKSGASAPTTKKSALLHLVDLAGSERQKSTDAAGERLKEASAINKSLSALGNVIKALVDLADGKERHVPYRDSKLTFLLKDALGGRSRCTLLACVSPAHVNLEETMSTLKFAQRAKLVKVRAVANEEAVGSSEELVAEVSRLRALLAEGGSHAGGGGGHAFTGDASAKVFELEDMMAKANRAAAAAAKDSEQELEKLKAKLENAKDLCACLDKNLQSAKMVIRLRDEALKKKLLSPESVNAEIEELKKQVEHPPEVVRVRIELAALQERAERLQAENERSANRGRLATAENELKDLRKLIVAEGELAAKALDEKASAMREKEETDERNKTLEERVVAAERRATECEEIAESARSAQLAAEVLENEHKMAKESAEADRARIEATFQENKEVMEEMFSKLESLMAYKAAAEKEKATLEARVEEAAAKAAGANSSFEETVAALESTREELAKAKGEMDAALEAQKEELERSAAASRAEFEAELESRSRAHESAVAELKTTHEAEMSRLQREHEDAIVEAKSEGAGSAEAMRAEHGAEMEAQAKRLEEAFAERTAELEASHARALDALHAENEVAMQKMREEHEANKSQLVAAHDSKMSAQSRAFAEQIEKINAAQAEAIAALEHKHAEEISDVNAKLNAALEQGESSESSEEAHNAELVALNEEHTKALGELESEYKAQIADLEKELAVKDEANAEAQAVLREELVSEHATALEEQKGLLSAAFAADIRSAEKKLAAAKEEISRAKSAAAAEFSAASNAQTQIRQLQELVEAKDDEIRSLERRVLSSSSQGDDAVAASDAQSRADARLDAAKAARKRAEERAHDMENKMSDLTREVEEAKSAAAASKSKASAARSRIDSLEMALHAAKVEIAHLKGIEPPASVAKTPARTPSRTPATKRPLAGRTPSRTPATMGTARRVLSAVNAEAPPASPSQHRPVKHMRFDDSPDVSAKKPTESATTRPELQGIRRGTGRLLSKPAVRVQADVKPPAEQ
jgi:hypothetical protein